MDTINNTTISTSTINTSNTLCGMSPHSPYPLRCDENTVYCSMIPKQIWSTYGKKTHFTEKDVVRVIINDPAVIVFFKDGTKETVTVQDGDVFSPEAGISLAILKHICGGSSKANKALKKWVKMDSDRKAAEKKAEEDKEKAKIRKQKLREKHLVKKVARKNRMIEEQIRIQKEAYIQALEQIGK